MLSVICREGTTSTQKKTSHKGSEKTHVYLLICVVLKKELDPIHLLGSAAFCCFSVHLAPHPSPTTQSAPSLCSDYGRLANCFHGHRSIGLPLQQLFAPLLEDQESHHLRVGSGRISSYGGCIYIYIYIPGFPKWFWLTGFFHCQRRQPSFWRVELNPQNRGSQTGSRFLRYTPEV